MNTSPCQSDEPVQSFSERAGIVTLILVPFILFLYAVASAWLEGRIDLFYIGLMLIFYVLTGLGITIGFHRLFTHGSFKTNRVIESIFAILGSMAFQGNLIEWCSRHSHHHQHSDKEEDPHSPWRYGHGFKNLLKGFFHAQFVWMLSIGKPLNNNCANKLNQNPVTRFVDKTVVLWMILSLLLPTLIGYFHDPVHGMWRGFVWGGAVRIFLLQHVTWAVNSYCHIWGSRPFRSNDQSTNSVLFAILAFGEGNHNTHHTFPNSCKHGIDRPWLDLSYLIIRFLSVVGLASDLVIPRKAKVDAKRVPDSP